MSIYKADSEQDRFKKILMQMDGQASKPDVAGLQEALSKPQLGDSYKRSLSEQKTFSVLSPEQQAEMGVSGVGLGETKGARSPMTSDQIQGAKLGVDATVGFLKGIMDAAEKQRLTGKKIEQLKAQGVAEGSTKANTRLAEGQVKPLRELMAQYRAGLS